MNILVNDDLFDDLADEPINDLYEMAKTIDSVESYGTFEKDWLKITNRKSLDNLKILAEKIHILILFYMPHLHLCH